MTNQRMSHSGTRWVFAVLLGVWALLVAWQAGEHRRVEQAARSALINRAKDISTTLGLVLRSQRHFGVIPKERLESALQELLAPDDLTAVAMLNAGGEVVASAGAPIDFSLRGLVPTGEHWGRDTVTLMNLVDLGSNVASDFEGTNPPIVLPRPERSATNRPPPPPTDDRVPPPPMEGRMRPPSELQSTTTNEVSLTATNRPRGRGGRDREGRPRFGRPFWMSEEEYQAMVEKQGVHSFVIALSTASVQTTVQRDLWLRLIIGGLASVSVLGFGLAWRNLLKSSELELRLVRAAELNARLKDMNLAAAGLAHETKNPLNIIRGQAQMIARSEPVSEDIRLKSRAIVDEADRVTAQLNEFINYSRPREVRRVHVALNAAVAEVVRALGHDLEDKQIRVTVASNLPDIEADEQLLRQALFNLLLNATQAVERGGEVQVVAEKRGGTEAILEIRDNGPGVPAELREDIFKPYFTTTQKGTGLGLAVVKQIVLAHGWEIQCRPNEPRGAIFRLSHLRLVGGA